MGDRGPHVAFTGAAGYLRDVQAGRVPSVVHLVGRAALVVFALVPLVLLLTRAAPPAPARVASPPNGLGGIGTGLLDPPSGPPTPVPVSAAGPANVNPAPQARPGPVPAGAPGTAPSGAPGTTGDPGSTPSVPDPTPETPPPPKPLRGSYAITAGDPNGTDSYQVTVTIINPAQVDQTGWTVTVKLPAGETVTAVSDATFVATAAAFRFRPSGNDTVPARGAVSFTFTVGGTLAGPPVACRLDGRSCG